MSASVSNFVGGVVSDDIRQTHKPTHLTAFKRLGYSSVEPLARGMESVVYALSDDAVGKVWFKRSADSVADLQRFYEELAENELPFETPHIRHVDEAERVVISIEDRLPGTPFGDDERAQEAPGMNCLVETLAAIATATAPSVRNLLVLNEAQSPWGSATTFESGLLALIDQRVDRFGNQLRRSVERFDGKADAIKQLLRNRSSEKQSLFHGDLGGGNLLVDANFKVVSVLDFGFLSGIGDARFDAAVASGVFDMWSSKAQLRQHQFDALLDTTFGYDREALLTLRAAYAIIIANAYDPEGNDGQFWWSSTFLNRPDVHELLGAG